MAFVYIGESDIEWLERVIREAHQYSPARREMTVEDILAYWQWLEEQRSK